MTYEETIAFLYQQLPVFHRDGAAAVKPGLANTLRLCEHLDNPQNKFKSVHVAGTNGKGSTSHMLAAILQSAGYKVGLYTSPHLKDFTERIRVSGQPIEKERVVNFVNLNRIFIQENSLSFFELSVGLAFQEFAEQEVDVAVIEVGLGGRLDSTNVITPLLSVITNISFDHMEFLGSTLPEIAGEKAGIIKPGVAVVVGERQRDTDRVFTKIAKEKQASLWFATDRFVVHDYRMQQGFLLVNVEDIQGEVLSYRLQLSGTYQRYNLPAVLQAIAWLRRTHFQINDTQIEQGLRRITELTGLKGRWQKIGELPITYCDTAHNVAGIRAVLTCVESIEYRELWFVLGCVEDKDVSGILSLLPRDARYLFCEAPLPRAMPAGELLHLAQVIGLQGVVIEDVNKALAFARIHANEQDLVVVTGSTYVVAEIDGL